MRPFHPISYGGWSMQIIVNGFHNETTTLSHCSRFILHSSKMMWIPMVHNREKKISATIFHVFKLTKYYSIFTDQACSNLHNQNVLLVGKSRSHKQLKLSTIRANVYSKEEIACAKKVDHLVESIKYWNWRNCSWRSIIEMEIYRPSKLKNT